MNTLPDDGGESQPAAETPVVKARPWLERPLGVFTEVRPGEGPTAVFLLLNVFLVLAAFYFVKPVREGWLAVSDFRNLAKIEIKAYSSFAQSILLLGVVPLYATVAAHLPRSRLITLTTLFFASNLILFWLLHPDRTEVRVPYLGIAFYLWVGIFAVTVVAQFWSFATDLYSSERGNRLFPLIAIGSAAGAAAGSWMAQELVRLPAIDSYDLLLLATIPLLLALAITRFVDQRGQTGRRRFPERREGSAAPDPEGPFDLIFGNRYLLMAAMLALLINWVGTNGENILFAVVQDVIRDHAAEQGLTGAALSDHVKESTTAFYGNLYFWVNILSLVIQAFLASRILRWGGFAAILFLTPLVSLLSYGLMAVFPALAVIRFLKILENSSNYSVNNTARHLLWLPTSPTAIYKAKTAIDTAFVRVGDGLAAATILLATRVWPISITSLLLFNVFLVIVWGVVAWDLARENRRLVASLVPSPAANPAGGDAGT